MGKREIGKLSIFDIVVSIMIAELAVMVIEDTEISLIMGIIPIVTLMLTQIIVSFITQKSKKIRELVEGQPTILIENGKIKEKQMAKERYSIDDLLTQVREKNINNLADVEFAILETSGKLSVFPKSEKSPVTKEDLNIKDTKSCGMTIPLVADGRLLSRGLDQINKDELWLSKQLSKNGYKDLKDIYFASIDNAGKLFVDPIDKPH